MLAMLRATAVAELSAVRGGALFLADRDVSRASDSQPQGAAGHEEPTGLQGVVSIDSVVVGFVEATLVELGEIGRVCRIEAIYVEPGAREVGAGEALMDLVTDFATAAGAVGIDSPVLPGQREEKNFFEASGFAARLIVMHRASPAQGATRGRES